MESSRDMIPEYVYSRQAEFENSEVYSRTIERRYQGEDQMLSYISQGNLKECLHIFQSNDGTERPLIWMMSITGIRMIFCGPLRIP